MESLQVYIDTDDSDSGSSDFGTKFNAEKCTTGPSANFFGFVTNPSKLLSEKKSLCVEGNKANHKSDDENADDPVVPIGDFWKDFIPDPSNTEVSNVFGMKKDDNHLSKSNMVSPSSDTRKRPYSCTQESQTLLAHDNDHQRKNVQDPNHSELNALELKERKVFYIHTKIAPYLMSKTTCRCASKRNASWQSHDRAINRLMWNRPNFSHLLLAAGMDSLVKIWSIWSSLDRCVMTLSHHSKAVRNAMWGHQGREIISCSYDKTAIVTDVESGKMKSRYIHPGFVMASCLHPVDPNCFVTGTDNLIQFWDQRTPISPTMALSYKDRIGHPHDLLFIHNGRELISCNDLVSRDSADRTIMVWDVKSGNVISNQIYQERYTCTRLKQGPNCSQFLAQSQGGYVALFSTTRPYKMDKNKRFEGHEMQGYNIGFDISHDGSMVYSGSANGGIHCYDYRSGRLVKKCADGNRVITDVACHPVLSSLVASSSWGGSISLWQ